MSSAFWKRFGSGGPTVTTPSTLTKTAAALPANPVIAAVPTHLRTPLDFGPVTQVTKMADAASQPTTATAVPTKENTMSILSKIAGKVETGISSSIKFITTVFSKTAEIDKVLIGLTPMTKAALLSTFYDVVKTGVSAEGVVQDASMGNFTGAVTLSTTTVTLVKDVWSDLQTDASVAKADLQALGAIVTPAAAAGV